MGTTQPASMVKLVDTADLKSAAFPNGGVPVQVRLEAPVEPEPTGTLSGRIYDARKRGGFKSGSRHQFEPGPTGMQFSRIHEAHKRAGFKPNEAPAGEQNVKLQRPL